MNGKITIRFLACLLALCFTPVVASAKKVKFMKCGKPLPLQLKPFSHKPQRIDFLCRNSGCHKSPANDKQNAIKNNFCAPTNKISQVALKTLGDLGDASTNLSSIPKGEPPKGRPKLATIITLDDGTKLGEGQTVTFVGYVLDANARSVRLVLV